MLYENECFALLAPKLKAYWHVLRLVTEDFSVSLPESHLGSEKGQPVFSTICFNNYLMRVNVIKKGYKMLNATKGRAKNVVNFFFTK